MQSSKPDQEIISTYLKHILTDLDWARSGGARSRKWMIRKDAKFTKKVDGHVEDTP